MTTTATRTVSHPLNHRLLLAVVLVVGVALALAFLPPLAAIWLVFGSGLVALVLLRPITGLYILPFAVSIGSLLDFALHGLHVGPTDVIVAALVLASLARLAPHLRSSPGQRASVGLRQLISSARAKWRREPVRLALYASLIAYLAVVTVSLAVATDRVSTLKEILKWGEVAVLVPIGAWLLRDLTGVRALAWCVLGAGAMQACVGFAQWVVGGSDRVYGTFAQPNPFAGYLNFALPLAIALVLFSPDVRERWLSASAAVLLAVGELLARSRGATLGLIAALVVIAVVGWHRERLAGWVAGIGLPVVAVAWVTHLVPRSLQQQVLDQLRLDDASLCNHVNDANFSNMERLAHWAAGLRMFLAHPLLGVGAGNYDAAYARYETSCWTDSLSHAHNYYINAAAETGIVGLIAFLALTGATFALGWSAVRANRLAANAAVDAVPPAAVSPGSAPAALAPYAVGAATAYQPALARALALGFFAAVVALAVHNFTDDLFVHAMELQFALCLAALLAIVRLSVLRRGTP